MSGTHMSIEETIEVVKALCQNFCHPSIQEDVDKAMADVAELSQADDMSKEDVLFAYYSTLGQIVTRVSIINSMEQFAAAVEKRVQDGVSHDEAISQIMTEAGLQADIAGAVDVHNNI